MVKYGLDFNGVLADTNRAKSDWIRRNLNIEVEPWKTDKTLCVPIIGAEAYEGMSDYVFSRNSTLLMQEVPGALSGVACLSRHADLYLVTMRSGKRMDYAKEWLEQMDILGHFTGFGDIRRPDGTTKTKVELAREFGLDVMIDDDERHLVSGVAKEKLILFKNGASSDYTVPNGVDLATNWEDVRRILGYWDKRDCF